MTAPSPANDGAPDADSAAAAWLVAWHGGSADREALDVWLAQSAANRDAWNRAQQLWSDLALLQDDPAIAALRREAREAMAAARPRPRQGAWLLRAAAASVAVAVLGGAVVGWFASPLGRREAPATQTYATAVGQRATYRLADGSLVTLNTASTLKVGPWGRERRVTLARGQAYFQVAKDARHPFVVAAGHDRVTAVGTAFEVRLDSGRVAVTLVEGRVRIAAPGANGERTLEMNAGSQFVDANAHWQLSEIATAPAVSWLQGQLVFDNEPLSAVVAEMNRYSSRKLVVTDPGLARTPISGVFPAGDVDAFAAALHGYGLARVNGPTDQQIALVRARPR